MVVVLSLCSRALMCARGVFCADSRNSLKLRRRENFRLVDIISVGKQSLTRCIICDDELVAMCMSVVYVMI